jgi:hypothetical protein
VRSVLVQQMTGTFLAGEAYKLYISWHIIWIQSVGDVRSVLVQQMTGIERPRIYILTCEYRSM